MKHVTITLDFEQNPDREEEEISDADVYNYLTELMDNNCLSYEIVDAGGE